MTHIAIDPSEDLPKRIRAVAYYFNLEIGSARKLVHKDRYRPITGYVKYIPKVLEYTKELYFPDCDFIRITS